MKKTAAQLWAMAQAELTRSNADPRHPYKTVVLSTTGVYPESRWVVKRHYDEQQHTWIYTDARTPKVEQIQEDQKVTLLYYHPKKKLQIRIKGKALLLTDGPAYQEHKARILQRPKDYSTLLTPGHPLGSTEVHYADEVHFTLLQIIPEHWDILLLDGDQHSRAIFEYVDSDWLGSSVVP